MTARLASDAKIPNPHLAALAPLIGVWKTAGHHAMMPGVSLHGRTAFEWHEGGAFLRMRSEIDEPGIPSAIAIIDSDDQANALTMLYFDERAVARRFDVAVDGGTFGLVRASPARFVRLPCSIARALDGKERYGQLGRNNC
jgi:hypothetical protein